MAANLDILQKAGALMSHSAERQSLVARNIAHADTPGYRARDLTDFATAYRDEGGFVARSTRVGHVMPASAHVFETRESAAPGSATPDGNTVNLEDQMIRGAETQRAHSRAITVYDKSMDILRLAMGRGR